MLNTLFLIGIDNLPDIVDKWMWMLCQTYIEKHIALVIEKRLFGCPDCVRWHRGEGKEMLINLIDGEIKKKNNTNV